MGGWVDGWMGGWVDGWMGGWVDGWRDGWVDGWRDGWVDELTDRWVDGWMGDRVLWGVESMHPCRYWHRRTRKTKSHSIQQVSINLWGVECILAVIGTGGP
eukprot:1002244-Prorocentrum_minimum.AAC.1